MKSDEYGKNGEFIGKEYVITEKEQFLPLYGITLKRNEYLIICRVSNNYYNNNCIDYLKEYKMILYKNGRLNVYIENSIEKALELIKRKRYNKIILISSI